MISDFVLTKFQKIENWKCISLTKLHIVCDRVLCVLKMMWPHLHENLTYITFSESRYSFWFTSMRNVIAFIANILLNIRESKNAHWIHREMIWDNITNNTMNRKKRISNCKGFLLRVLHSNYAENCNMALRCILKACP